MLIYSIYKDLILFQEQNIDVFSERNTNGGFIGVCTCVCLTSVVDSGDGVSIEHAVEEGVGVFRELRDVRERGVKYSSQYSPQASTHAHTHTHTHTHTQTMQ